MLLAANYVVKLSDYGTARLVDTSTMTKNIGTTYWMAPESTWQPFLAISGAWQAAGEISGTDQGQVFQEEPYTTKADIYSLGMLMFEIFTRSIPFSGMYFVLGGGLCLWCECAWCALRLVCIVCAKCALA